MGLVLDITTHLIVSAILNICGQLLLVHTPRRNIILISVHIKIDATDVAGKFKPVVNRFLAYAKN